MQFKKEDDEKIAAELAGQMDDDDDEGEMENADEIKDYEEIFLQQFPYLSVHYRNNKRKIDKFGKVKGWSIMAGGWVLPTCCSCLVN